MDRIRKYNLTNFFIKFFFNFAIIWILLYVYGEYKDRTQKGYGVQSNIAACVEVINSTCEHSARCLEKEIDVESFKSDCLRNTIVLCVDYTPEVVDLEILYEECIPNLQISCEMPDACFSALGFDVPE